MTKKETLVMFAIMVFYAAMDGWRDAWIWHDWLERHVVKWIAYFSLPAYVLWKGSFFCKRNLVKLIALSAVCLVAWRITYTVFGGQ